MINHVRTLLINTPNTSAEFEEPVDPGFVPLQMDGAELVWQRSLVPPQFPLRTRNFMATMWRNIAAQHPDYSRILQIDPREMITFTPLPQMLTGGVSFTGDGSGVMVTGSLIARPDVGIFSRRWLMEKVDDSTIRVTNPETMEFSDRDASFNQDCSAVIDLGDGISIRFISMFSVPNRSFELSAFAPFSFDLSSIASKLRTMPSLSQIFQLNDRPLGRMLLSSFLNSRTQYLALGSVVIAGAIYMSERRGL